MRVEPLAVEVGLGLVGLVEGGAGFAAAAPHRVPSAGSSPGPRLSAAARARHRQSLAAQPRVRDFAQRRGDCALRFAAGLRAGHPGGQGGARSRAGHARAGLRDAGALDLQRHQREGAACRVHRRRSVERAGHAPFRADRRHAHELFSRQDAKKLLDRVAATTPRWSRILRRSRGRRPRGRGARAGAARPGRARRRADQVGFGVAAVLDRERVDTLDDHHRLLLGHAGRRPSRPGPARGRGPARWRARGGASRPAWSGGSGWPTRLPVSAAPWLAPRSRRSAWWAWRSSSSVIWCRSWARAVRLVSVSAGRRVHSPRSATSCSCWETAAIVDVTGCCPVSSNAVVIQGILASTTDSPDRIRFRNVGISRCQLVALESSSPKGPPSLDGLAYGTVGGLDTRSLALAARPPDRPQRLPLREQTRPAPYLSRCCDLSTTHEPAVGSVSRLARWRSLLDHRTSACATREQTATPRRTPPRRCAFPPPTTCNRGAVVSTRSLALAARPPDELTAPPQPPPAPTRRRLVTETDSPRGACDRQ